MENKKIETTGLSPESRDYWLDKLAGEPAKCFIPYYGAKIDAKDAPVEQVDIEFDPGLTSTLLALSNKSDVRLYIVFVTALALVVKRYTGSNDVLLGTPIYKQDVDGDLINTVLVIRQEIEEDIPFRGLLKQVSQSVFEANKHQNYPVDTLLYKLNIPFSPDGDFPLFDISILLENIHYKKYIEHVHHNIKFCFNREGETITGTLAYNSALYDRISMERLAGHFLYLLKDALSDLNRGINQLGMLSEEEQRMILCDFNGPEAEPPGENVIHRIFENRVQAAPDRVAVMDENVQVTYGALNEKANRLARYLQTKGVAADTIVGLMLEPSVGMMTAILGVLKAGGCYLPIDTELPAHRVLYMIHDSRTPVLITYSHIKERSSSDLLREEAGQVENDRKASWEIILLDRLDDSLQQLPGNNLPDISGPSDLVYIIYTSGSTGTPKAVVTRHSNVAAYLLAYSHVILMLKDDIVLQQASYAFDTFVEEVFAVLQYGGKIAIPRRGSVTDVMLLRQFIARHSITIVDCSPLLLDALNDPTELDSLSSVRAFLSGGDVLKGEYISNLKNFAQILNGYGPTEATVCLSFYKIPKGGEVPANVPVGKPITNYNVFILDANLHIQPIGVPGEICVAGPGVSRGYLNNPELTVEKFVLAHSSKLIARREEKEKKLTGTNEPSFPMSYELRATSCLYKTGDLGRWLPDGNIQYMGRIDQQVKIRGYRIEIGEIEYRLVGHPLVREAVVAVKEVSGDKALCAYYVPHTDGSAHFFRKTLREFLIRDLPEYMVPGYFVAIDKVPLTRQGKINRKALPMPEFKKEDDYEAARNETEKQLVEIWSGVLGVDREQIGIHTNFFEIGGHSLKATVLVSKISKVFGVNVPLGQVFSHPTIAELGETIDASKQSIFDDIAPVEEREYYPQSSAQKRLFFLDQLGNVGTGYNMPLALDVVGPLDGGRLEYAFGCLIRRHESLRTSFHIINDLPVQRVHDDVEFGVELYTLPVSDDHGVNNVIDRFVRPFDLSGAPLMRVGLVELQEEKHLLMLDMHHIVGDGTSDAVMAREFVHFYGDETPEPLVLQYKDFSAWQNNLVQGGKIKEQEQYWLDLYAGAKEGELPKLNLPADFTGAAVTDFNGERILFGLDGETAGRLRQLSLSSGATLYMTLLSAFYALLYKYTGQDDIIVGAIIAGRRHDILHDIIGMFVNTLPMRGHPDGKKTFAEFLKEIKAHAVDAFENQDVQLENLVDQLDLGRDLSRNPLFDVCFAMQNFEQADVEEKIDDVTFSLHPIEFKTSVFDIGIDVIEREEDIIFEIEYRTALFKRETIQRMAGHFEAIMTRASLDPSVEIGQIDMLTPEEKKQILVDFNDTSEDYPADKTVVQLFEEQQEKTPDAVAVTGLCREFESPASMNMTFRELNRRSDGLAMILQKKGARKKGARHQNLGSSMQETIVGLMMDRGIDMIVAILGILKAGGAFMPIDPDYPQDRVDYMMKDSGAKILLKSEIRNPKFETTPNDRKRNDQNVEVLNFEHLDFEFVSNFEIRASDLDISSLVYVLYTSGSTGKPKGVMVEHRNLTAYCHAYLGQCDIIPNDILLQQASFTFDTYMEEVFPTLLRGARLAVPQKDEILDIDLLSEFIDRQQVTIIDCSPLLLNELSRTDRWFNSVHTYISGGDALKRKYVEPFLSRGTVLNGYGPTEITVCVSFYRCTGNDPDDIPIGKPIANYHAYILDRDGCLLPVGVPGELCAAGAGLTRGYMNNPELTAEKFVLAHSSWLIARREEKEKARSSQLIAHREEKEKAPRSQLTAQREEKEENTLNRTIIDTGESSPSFPMSYELRATSCLYKEEKEENTPNRTIIDTGESSPSFPMSYELRATSCLYKTGDLARWLVDGNIEYLGRIDQQVKIRGYRVELEEIETRLLEHEAVKEVAVVTGTDRNGARFLCAYVVPRVSLETVDTHLFAERLRDYLAGLLPGYMVPAYFMPLEKLPLTVSGKVNRKALPEPEYQSAAELYIAPENEVEKQLADIWADVLELPVNSISTTADFFRLGGHSLRATVLAAKVRKTFEIEFPLSKIFASPTIKEFSNFIHGAVSRAYDRIDPVEKREYYPQSPAQKRLFFLDQLEDAGTSYNMPAVFKVTGKIDRVRFEGALNRLIGRHESLRTSFHTVFDEPVQEIHEEWSFKVDYLEIGGSDEMETAKQAFLRFVRPFDLTEAPLMRVGLLSFDDERHLLFLDMHHIIGDGSSDAILARDFFRLYVGEEPETAGVQYNLQYNLQYKDFAEWQNRLLEQGVIDKQESYWVDIFDDGEELPKLDLPYDFPRPRVLDYSGARLGFVLEPEDARRLRRLGGDNGATLYMVVLSLFNILLYKYSGQDDIIVGGVIAGRTHADLHHMIGMFVNTLALRNKPRGNKSCVEFLEDVKTNCLEAFENQDVPFEQLVDRLNVERDSSRNPLFDVTCIMQNFQAYQKETLTTSDGGTLAFETIEMEEKISLFDLSLDAFEHGEEISVNFEYRTGLFKEETIERLKTHWLNVLREVAQEPVQTIAQVNIMSPGELDQLLYDFNGGDLDYPEEKTLHQLFEEQAERTPDRVAAIGLGRLIEKPASVQMTYNDLNRRANHLAMDLQKKGVRQEKIVGLKMDRGIDMITCLLAILKAGGAFMPIDPDYPQERIDYLMKDSGADFYLDHRQYTSYTTYSSYKSYNSVESPATAGNLAFLIYTSGSTGKPKAILVEHRNLVAYIHSFLELCEIGIHDVMLQQASFTFDTFMEEVFPVLYRGGRIAIPQKNEIPDMDALSAFIDRYNVTIVDTSPLLLSELNATGRFFPTVHTYLSGGDLLKREYVESFLGRGTILNGYGPSECTVCVSFYRCTGRDPESMPIGKPISNYRIYILDRDGNPVPIGVPGELYAAGAGITRGYLNNPELTNEKYVSAHSSWLIARREEKEPKKVTGKRTDKIQSTLNRSSCGGPGGGSFKKNPLAAGGNLLYKSGDLVRWLPDGNIEFLGRIDDQVKVRGFRVELGEVRYWLLEYDGVCDAAVVTGVGDSGDKFICAYYVLESNGAVTADELRVYLGSVLPGYMVPAYFVELEKIPLTVSDKVDRRALPAPRTGAAGQRFNKAETATQEALTGIWADVLGLDSGSIGIDDGFFVLGGHSLKTTTLKTRIRKYFDVDLPLGEVFRGPTIRQLAQCIDDLRGEPAAVLVDDENLVLLRKNTGAEKHMFFVHDGSGDVEAYAGFCNRLGAGFNYWGLRADRLEYYCPRAVDMENLAGRYVEKIKNIQASGPYYIAGWSMGGTIGFEVVRQLEASGERVAFFAFIDAEPPDESLNETLPDREQAFTLESEKELIARELKDDALDRFLEPPKTLEELWPGVVRYFRDNPRRLGDLRKNIPSSIAEAVPGFENQDVEGLIFYLNMIRGLDWARDRYVPQGKIDAAAVYFATGEYREICRRWDEYCSGPVTYKEVGGDHYSIFEAPDVEWFAGVFGDALKSHE